MNDPEYGGEPELTSRIEVFNDSQNVMLKRSDLIVDRLARVFKLKPASIYLEEDITNHLEFPTDGKFATVAFGKYRVVGDACVEENPTRVQQDSPQPYLPTSSMTWGIPRPWAAASSGGPSPMSMTRIKKGGTSYESYWKRSIPYVSLSLDESCKNIVIDSTINNVYVKVPESTLCTGSIVAGLASKIGCPAEDLVILDAKLMEVTDDKDIEYWKTSSRKFYVAKKSEYSDAIKVKNRKKLSLARSRKKIIYTEGNADEDEDYGRLETKIAKIDSDLSAYINEADELKKFKSSKEEALKVLECKICKGLPSDPPIITLCCKQLVGCKNCFDLCMRENRVCPLCRADNPDIVVINGLLPLYSFFNT